MADSPTTRTLRLCRSRGWQAQVVEKWIAQARRRVDLWGVGDILALDGLPGSLLIQCTAASGHSARVKKSKAEPRLREWLKAGNRFAVWSWRKNAKNRWVVREEALDMELMDND